MLVEGTSGHKDNKMFKKTFNYEESTQCVHGLKYGGF